MSPARRGRRRTTEPERASASLTSMKKPLGASVALLICGVMLMAGCSEDKFSSAEGCLVTPTVSFQGRAYTEFDEVNSVSERRIRVGRLLGGGKLDRKSTRLN